MTHNLTTGRQRGLRAAARAAALAVALTGAGACSIDDILTVEQPDIALPETVASADALPAVLASAARDFFLAYGGSGGSEGQVLVAGLLADEFRSSDTFPTRNEVDRREILDENATAQDLFRTLARSRARAEEAARGWQQFRPEANGAAQTLAFAGYSYILFAENYCSGIPFSEVNADGSFAYGQLETTQQVLERALARFDAALGVDSISAATRNWVNVGRGRTLVNLGRYAEAAAAVAAVPSSFVFNAEYSENTAGQNNGVFSFNINQRRFSVAPGAGEGTNGLPFVTAGDPRVVITDAGRTGFDRATRLYNVEKYPARTTSIPIATGAEARLIEAEAALQAGNVALFGTKINEARAANNGTALTAPAYTAVELTTLTANQADRVTLLFRERAFSLYATSHRLGDLRRLARATTAGLSAYGRGAQSVFPTGAFHKGSEPYGVDTSLPLPIDERNNPNYRACDNVAP